MTNNEFNCYLKTLEDVHAKKFMNDKGYLDRCKANKNLSTRDYKIHVNHGLSEYFDKYGKKLKNGKVFAYTKDELWLMNKHANYWKIPNDSKFIYFEVPTNLKPLWVSFASLATACVVAGAVTAGIFYFKNRPNAGGGGEGGGGEEEIGSAVLTYKINIPGAVNTDFYWLDNEDDYTSAKTEYILDQGSTLYKIPCFLCEYNIMALCMKASMTLTKANDNTLVKNILPSFYIYDISGNFDGGPGYFPDTGDKVFEKIASTGWYEYTAYFYLDFTDIVIDSASYCFCINKLED